MLPAAPAVTQVLKNAVWRGERVARAAGAAAAAAAAPWLLAALFALRLNHYRHGAIYQRSEVKNGLSARSAGSQTGWVAGVALSTTYTPPQQHASSWRIEAAATPLQGRRVAVELPLAAAAAAAACRLARALVHCTSSSALQPAALQDQTENSRMNRPSSSSSSSPRQPSPRCGRASRQPAGSSRQRLRRRRSRRQRSGTYLYR